MAATAMQRLSLSDGHATRVPNKNDVLCGRGGSINSHPGNEHFREMVEKHRRVYLNARFKQEKRLIATSIVSDIRALDPPGRFLAKDPVSGTWCDIGDEKARDKTSQALRENAPSIRAGIKGGEKKPRPKSKRKAKTAPAPPVVPPSVQSAYPNPMQPYNGSYNGYYAQPVPPQSGAMPMHMQPGPPPTAPPGSHPGPPVTSYPGQPMAAHPGQPVAHPGQPIGAHPGQPVGSYGGQPVSSHPGQPVAPQSTQQTSPHPGQPAPSHPGQPAPSHPGQPAPSHPGHYPPPHPTQYQYTNGSVPVGSPPPWPNTAIASNHRVDQSRVASPQSNRVASPQSLQSNQSSAGVSSQNGHVAATHPVPHEVPSSNVSNQNEEKPRETHATSSLQSQGTPYTPPRENEGHALQYSPIETNSKNMNNISSNGYSSHARKSPELPQESRNEESQVMEIEEEGTGGSSLLTMVANHILGAWDTDAICGIDSDFAATKNQKNVTEKSFSQSMPPPKARKRNSGNGGPDIATRWSFGNSDVLQNGSLLSPGGSFESQGISPAVSMDVDGGTPICPKDWRTEGADDGHSLGSVSSGLISMNENVLNQVPSWEGSFHSMSTASVKPKDPLLAHNRRDEYSRRDESRTGSEISYDTTILSQDYVDSRMAIALQQQENVAAFEAFKKRHEGIIKKRTNQTARSSALDRIKTARDREQEHHSLASGHTNDSCFGGVGDYIPPTDNSLPQEEADHRLAMELQRFEQARAGTVQQMERILKESAHDEEKPSRQRTGRSVYKF